MPRAQSIPKHLHGPVVERFTLGNTPNEILKWLKEKHDVSTSRSSVRRVINGVLTPASGQMYVSLVNRVRAQAVTAQDSFERVGRQFWSAYSAIKPGLSAEDARFHATRLAGLSRMSVHFQRGLRGAGVLGVSAQRALEEWSGMLEQTRAAVRAEDGIAVPKSGRFTKDNPATQAANESATPSPEPAESDSSALVEARFAGEALKPCPITVPMMAAEDPTPTAELDLTPTEQVFAAGYLSTWERRHFDPESRDPASPMITDEIRYQKRALQLRHVFDPNKTPDATLTDEVELKPSTIAAEPYDDDPETREAWRFGREGLPAILELPTIARYPTPDQVPLTEVEEAWCAGAGQRAPDATGPGLPVEQHIAMIEGRMRWTKWRLIEAAAVDGHRPSVEPPPLTRTLVAWLDEKPPVVTSQAA